MTPLPGEEITMDGMREVIAIAVGFVLRIGIPVGITALSVYFLRRLDRAWQAEAERLQAELEVTGQLGMILPCWEIIGCDPQAREACPAYRDRDRPCWQVFRDGRGHLKEPCLTCQLFRDATVLVSVEDSAEEA
jgi:hypothetical protein